MDFDAAIVFTPTSADPALGEVLLESFLTVDPGCDPVIDQNARSGSVTVHLSLSADDAVAAARLAGAIVTDAAGLLARGGSTSARPTAMHVDAHERSSVQAA